MNSGPFRNWLSQGMRMAYAYMQNDTESYRPEDESFSSYTGKRWMWDGQKDPQWGRWYRVINWLFRDPQHCWKAIETDRGYRAGQPPEWWDLRGDAEFELDWMNAGAKTSRIDVIGQNGNDGDHYS